MEIVSMIDDHNEYLVIHFVGDEDDEGEEDDEIEEESDDEL